MSKPHKPFQIIRYCPRPRRRRWILSPWRWWVVYVTHIAMVVIFGVLLFVAAGEGEAREPVAVEAYTVTAPVNTRTSSISMISTPREEPRVEITSRGDREPVMMECTAYTLRPEECGKEPGDPGYGITASGAPVEPWHTVAAGKDIPFGTKVYIPFFKDKPNGGVFTVLDRGGSVGPDNIDIYMEDLWEALEFGRRTIEVYILPDAVMEGAE